MNCEIKKIDFIKNMAVFQDFSWALSVKDYENNIAEFKKINILYGRNYSGKTVLSRILRALETGFISDKYASAEFQLSFNNGTNVAQDSLARHGKIVRVFNEDFVRENLHFITNPNESIVPFAILGDDNNKIEEEIKTLENKLGSQEEGKETGLYLERIKANLNFTETEGESKKANDNLNKQLGDKATDRKIGIKYKPERFGDQNYNIQKLKTDVEKVQDKNYQPPTDEQLTQFEKLISEKTLQSMPPFHSPSLNASTLADETETLVTKKISRSDKIEELIKDAILNRWVNEGRRLHKDKRSLCAFCGNPITPSRWKELEKHFDEESEQLEKNIDALIVKIESTKSSVTSALSIDKACFYSKFHKKLDELTESLKNTVGKYIKSLDDLLAQLKVRKDDLLNPKEFKRPNDTSNELTAIWNSYEAIRRTSESFSTSLGTEQKMQKRLCG